MEKSFFQLPEKNFFFSFSFCKGTKNPHLNIISEELFLVNKTEMPYLSGFAEEKVVIVIVFVFNR